MIFRETKLKGAYIIEYQKAEDDRGFFARTFCKKEFEAKGLNGEIAQCSVSYNRKKGTFRGLHFQVPPYQEEKIVTCLQGAFLDYIVDLREDSSTYKQWISVELTAVNELSLYVPKSFAHGFFTLMDDTVVQYQISEFYQPGYARGLRFDDPTFNIRFPFPITAVAEKDRAFQDLSVPVG
jgi:dTDP-4-dehydrorhamnose 3,5-epimerase